MDKPAAAARRRSRKLCAQIAARMAATRGYIGFDEFMHTALYAAGLGYYRHAEWGAAGDFITAPLLGDLTAKCLAAQCAEVLAELGGGDVLEFAPGNGQLAADILPAMAELGQLPRRYFLVDRGGQSRARMRNLLTARCGKLAARVVWRARPPRNFEGVIIANELLDAIPCIRFEIADGRARELGVALRQNKFCWTAMRPLAQNLQRRLAKYALPTGYKSEINPRAEAFVRALGGGIKRGVVLLLDYGFPAPEFYHPQRRDGTLMCHYQRHAHPDPFFYPGAQDISAHVDFTSIAAAARAGGLRLLGYAAQSAFLLSLGILEYLAAQLALCGRARGAAATRRAVELSRQAQLLTMPHEMGELFKVIAFGKNFPHALRGFVMHDRRAALHDA